MKGGGIINAPNIIISYKEEQHILKKRLKNIQRHGQI